MEAEIEAVFADRRKKVSEEQQGKAAMLRLQGHTYKKIASEMGVSVPHAQTLVWKVLEPDRFKVREGKRKKAQISKKARQNGERRGGAPKQIKTSRQKERAREYNKKYMRELRETRKAYIYAIKNVPCADCSLEFHPVCMDFDHRPEELKEFNIGERFAGVNLDLLKEEIAKCDIVCANCHRLRTWRRDGIYRSRKK